MKKQKCVSIRSMCVYASVYASVYTYDAPILPRARYRPL